MYTIRATTADGEEFPLHNPKVKALTCGDPWFEVGDNINGSAEFTVYAEHPYYDKVQKLTTDITFYEDGEEKFNGRVLYDDEDNNGSKVVYVEGELAFLCDSIQRPAVFHDISVYDFFYYLIDGHNNQVEERKQFQVGYVTVEDSNDSLYRYLNWETTREAIEEKLIDSLGGHLVVRKEDGVRYLDYLSDESYYSHAEQTIEFGKNLLDYAKNVDATDIATCIIPLGATLDEEDVDEDLEAIADSQRVDITSVNDGIDYVTDDAAVEEYGKIFKTVIWEDVTLPENLMAYGYEYLETSQYESMVLELTAIDLSSLGNDIEAFEMGHQIRCISEPRGMDAWFPLATVKTYIMDFTKNTLTLGDESAVKTYTSSNRESTATIEDTIASLPQSKTILEKALASAQDLIDSAVASGYAIHEPNEFIVADDPDYKTQAKYLWRWGLGGLAHYSNGYDGDIDGIALTMDGQIAGEMIAANSIQAGSLSVEYTEAVTEEIQDIITQYVRVTSDGLEVASKVNGSYTTTKAIVGSDGLRVTSNDGETSYLDAISSGVNLYAGGNIGLAITTSGPVFYISGEQVASFTVRSNVLGITAGDSLDNLSLYNYSNYGETYCMLYATDSTQRTEICAIYNGESDDEDFYALFQAGSSSGGDCYVRGYVSSTNFDVDKYVYLVNSSGNMLANVNKVYFQTNYLYTYYGGYKRMRYVDAGSATIEIDNGGDVCSVDVNFNVAFSSNPVVCANAVSSYPGTVEEVTIRNWSAEDDGTYCGFTVYMRRTTAVDTGIRWIAVGYLADT